MDSTTVIIMVTTDTMTIITRTTPIQVVEMLGMVQEIIVQTTDQIQEL